MYIFVGFTDNTYDALTRTIIKGLAQSNFHLFREIKETLYRELIILITHTFLLLLVCVLI